MASLNPSSSGNESDSPLPLSDCKSKQSDQQALHNLFLFLLVVTLSDDSYGYNWLATKSILTNFVCEADAISLVLVLESCRRKVCMYKII